MSKEIVAAFDFDGTITTKDTFVPFLYQAFGYERVFKAFVQLAHRALLVGLGLSNRDKFKEYLMQSLFSGESYAKFSKIGTNYGNTLTSLFRPAALNRVAWHKAHGHRCIMVSASLDLYLNEVVKMLGFDDLLCTMLSHNNQVFDGSLKGKNCRCMEKVDRLQLLLGDLELIEIYAYGDSAGDREMLAVADHKFYRPFEAVRPFIGN
jgi:HAD superfamily hydrolase (TIGR01490 family)